MGYVHDTDLERFIAPAEIQKTAGTWTPTISTNLISDVRTAANATFELIIPIALPGSSAYRQGAKLRSIDVWYKVATAALDAFADVVLTKQTLSADTVAVAGAAVTTTIDTAHDTDAERLAEADHKMTVTLATPAFIGKNEAYILRLGVDAAANSVFTLFGA